MFCGKCGRPIPDGQDHCEFCAPASQVPSVPAADPQPKLDVWGENSGSAAYDQAPAQPKPNAQPVFELNAPVKGGAPKSQKPKKAKGGKKGIIAIVSLVLVAIVALTIVFWGNISRFFLRTFGDEAEYQKAVMGDNVVAVADDVVAAYDQALQVYAMENPAADYTITLEMNETLTSLVETLLASEGIRVDLSWVKNIVLAPHMEMYEDTLRYDIGVGLNDVNVATVSAVWDTAENKIYVGVPELHKTYLELDLSDYLRSSEIAEMQEALVMSRQLTKAFAEALPEGKDLKELIVKYSGIVIDSLTDTEKENRTMEIDGLEQELLVLTTDLSQKDILQVVIDVLEEAQDDALIEEILTDLEGAIAQVSGEEMDLYGEFSERVEFTLENISEGLEEVGTDTYLTIDTYTDKKDNVVGMAFTVDYDGFEESFSFLTVTEGDKWAFEAEVGDLYISGDGTKSGDATSGSYTFSMYDEDYITVELEDFAFTGGNAQGTVRLIPEELEAYGPYAGMLDGMALAMTFDDKSVTLGIETNGTTLVAFTLSGDISEASPISIPSSISIEDDAAGMKWVSQLDLDAILESLRKAGVPDEYMDMAEYLVDMFHDQF